MIIALAIPPLSSFLGVVVVGGGRLVTRAKKLMSDFMRGHGRVPAFPIPRRVVSAVVAAAAVVVDAIGVVATMRVSGWVSIGDAESVWGLESKIFGLLVWLGLTVLDMLH